MTKLILVRHSAVQIEPDSPSYEWRLSAQGRSRCIELATSLAGYDPRIIVSSNEPKAMETGQILAESLAVPWHSEGDLHEHDRRGVAYYEDRVLFERVVASFFADPDELVFGRETAAEATARFDEAVRAVLAKYRTDEPGDVIIVAHGTVMTLFLCQYNQHLDPFNFWCSLSLPCHFVVSLPDFSLEA